MSRLLIAALAVVTMTGSAFSVDLGLVLGSRTIIPHDIQGLGFLAKVEFPLRGNCRLGLRAGYFGASAEQWEITQQLPGEASLHYKAGMFDLGMTFSAIIPVTQETPRGFCLMYGVGLDYYRTESEGANEGWYVPSDLSGHAAVVNLSAGAHVRLTEVVSLDITTELPALSAWYARMRWQGLPAEHYLTTQFGEYSPTLNLAVALTL